MKKKQLVVGGMLVTALSLSSAANAQQMMNNESMMNASTTSTSVTTTTTSMMNTSMMSDMNLSEGSRGEGVVGLQTWLEEKGYLSIPAGVSKGYFGPLTKAALVKYQSSVNLPALGFYGPMTRAMVKSNMGMSTGSTMATSEAGVMVGGAMMVASKDIVDNAVNANNVTTLVAAVKAADLVETLKGTGPFTVFAPTNSAFAKLAPGTVDTLLKLENKKMLADILTYHVVAGRYTSAQLTDGLVLTTVEGKPLMFTKVDGKLMINGSAMVETADVISSNGVTHVVDSVLMPPTSVTVGGAMMVSNLDIVANAMNAKNVTTLVAAVKAAGLVDTLKGKGPFTVFAPTNDAFEDLPAGTVDTLLKTENKGKLTDILTYHVVPGKYMLKDLEDGDELTTVEGTKLKITESKGKIMINGKAMIETADVVSTNGVTHVIDMVLMP